MIGVTRVGVQGGGGPTEVGGPTRGWPLPTGAGYRSSSLRHPNPLVRMANRTATVQTNLGPITLELFDEQAPETAGNFAKLVEKGFYDGIVFHRVIDGFMIQGGCPMGRGTGGPGYTIKDEFGAGLAHDGEGILSMANAGPNTGGSQFFITLAATPWLDGKHAIFGKVIEGMDVIRQIGRTATGPGDRPLKDIVMEKVTLSEG